MKNKCKDCGKPIPNNVDYCDICWKGLSININNENMSRDYLFELSVELGIDKDKSKVYYIIAKSWNEAEDKLKKRYIDIEKWDGSIPYMKRLAHTDNGLIL